MALRLFQECDLLDQNQDEVNISQTEQNRPCPEAGGYYPRDDVSEDPQQQQVHFTTTTIPHPTSRIDSCPRQFRHDVRRGEWIGPTNGICPGYLQCNLVVLPAGPVAFDFLLFCQRNPQACPLLEVCEEPSSFRSKRLAKDADLRTDIPKYVYYDDGWCKTNPNGEYDILLLLYM
jgi:hypothetical protein